MVIPTVYVAAAYAPVVVNELLSSAINTAHQLVIWC